MDYNQFQPIEDMSEVTPIFKKIFDGGKTYGTDTLRMGFYHDSVLTAKVEENKIYWVNKAGETGDVEIWG